MAITRSQYSQIITMDAQGDKLDGHTQIEHIAFANAAAGENLKLKDESNTTIADVTATADNQYIEISHLKGAMVTDLEVEELDGGEVYVQYK